MKCSHCYAENPPWSTVCSSCSQPVLRLEICSQGHLLPPGVQECSICPSLWPEISAFAGPPLLRGLLWVDAGSVTSPSDPGEDMAYLEIRDQESALALTLQPSGDVHLTGDDDGDVVCRILMRPEGVQVCNKIRPAAHTGPLAFEPLLPGEKFHLGGVLFRLQVVQPPAWVQKVGGGG